LVSWWKRNEVHLRKAMLSVPDYTLQIGKLLLLSADVWGSGWGDGGDDNVAWSRVPSSHIEKRCAESGARLRWLVCAFFPSVSLVQPCLTLISQSHPSTLTDIPPVVTTCICVCSCFSVRFHKLTFHLHITLEKKTKTKPKTFIHLFTSQSQNLLKVSVCSSSSNDAKLMHKMRKKTRQIHFVATVWLWNWFS